jgi:hypothetical protein
MIYIKEHNALFKSPRVEEPNILDDRYYKHPEREHNFGFKKNEYHKDKAAYQEWLSSKIQVEDDHPFIEGVEYEKDVHFTLMPTYYPANKKEQFPKFIAIPIKEDKEKGLEPSKESHDLAPVASHSCTSGNSIQPDGSPYKKAIDYYADKPEFDLDWQGHFHLFLGALLPKLMFSERLQVIDAVALVLSRIVTAHGSVATESDSSNVSDNQINTTK